MPILFSFVKQDTVTEMEDGCIIGSELFIHYSFIDNDLLFELAVSPIVIKLECLNEFVLAVRIPFKCLDNWHAPLIRLNDLHGKIFDIILIVFCDQVTSYRDRVFVASCILACVIFSRKVEKLRLRILNLVLRALHILF